MDGLARLNVLSPQRVEVELLQCCGVRAWARALAAARPFADTEKLLEEADRVWCNLGPEHWLEALRAHARIGERQIADFATDGTARWSEQEQANIRCARAAVLEELAAANRAYEEHFGHIFLICATGRSAEEVLTSLRERLRNEPSTELEIAAEEQRKITRIRLARLLSS